MIIFLGIGVLIVIGICIARFSEDVYAEDTGELMVWIGVFSLVISLAILGLMHADARAGVERHYAIKETIEESRTADISEYERAAITTTIVEHNKGLASIKYWNDTIFDVFIYDGLAELEPLK